MIPFDTDRVLRVSAPKFVAGAIVRGQRIVECAPILFAAVRDVGRDLVAFRQLCERRGWHCAWASEAA